MCPTIDPAAVAEDSVWLRDHRRRSDEILARRAGVAPVAVPRPGQRNRPLPFGPARIARGGTAWLPWVAAPVAAMLAAGSVSSSGAAESASWSPRLELFDGRFSVAPAGRLDLDAGAFAGQEIRPGFQSNATVRRGQIGMQGQVLPGLSYTVLWDFAPPTPGSQPDGGRLYEAQFGYAVAEGVTLRAGAFTPRHTLEASGGSFTQLFMERASIIQIATSLASGSSRVAAGIEGSGATWFATAYGTANATSPPADHSPASDRARGLAGRVALRPFEGPVLVGINGAAQLRPRVDGEAAVQLRDYPELRISPHRFLDTGRIPANQAVALGPELSGVIGPLHLAAEYQAIDIDADDGRSRRFEGWYAALALPLIGAPRHWDARNGAWAKPDAPALDPAAGQWGWLELAGRYSRTDLNDGPTRGGVQSIWTLGLNWYPEARLRVTMQAETGQIAGQGPDRPFQAVGWRISIMP